ncbi:MAG: TrmH family RNA methyltransferase [Anaerolineae bacterium]|nr:MAG: TrmH family RNA methyltransferase [Anaerolineae bacterium]
MMSDGEISVYQCPACGFRFPAESDSPAAATCPHCNAPTREAVRYLPHRQTSPSPLPSLHVEALLDNLRSAWNVGSIFRIADGAGIRRLHLCGITPPGDHPRIPKTALGAEKTIPWHSHPNGLHLARTLQERGYRLWALETTPKARPLFSLLPVETDSPLVLVVGNERWGVDPEILGLCEQHIFLPMQGNKESLNVAVAFGIAAYALAYTR